MGNCSRCDKAALDRSIFKTSAVAKLSTYDLLLQGQDLYTKHCTFWEYLWFWKPEPRKSLGPKKKPSKNLKNRSLFVSLFFWMFFGRSFQPFFGRPGRLKKTVQFLRCGDNSEERDGSTQMRFNRLSN